MGQTAKNVDRMRVGQVWAHGSGVYRLLADPESRPVYYCDEETGGTETHERLMVRAEPMPERDDIPDGGFWIDVSCFPYMRLMVDGDA